MPLAYVDGVVGDLADARIPLDDRGLLVGDGIFETMRTFGGKVVFLDAHRRRFEAGLAALGMPRTGEFDEAVDALVAAGLEASGGEDLYLRIQATSGPMLNIPGPGTPRVTGICKLFQAPVERQTKGVQLATTPYRLQHDSPLAGIKHSSFLPYIAARRDAIAHGADDALIWNTRGRPIEVSTANLFMRRGETIYAPGADEGAVAGVTRSVVIDLLRTMGWAVDEQAPRTSSADEAWMTNTTGGVIPITGIDGRAIPIGELTRALQDAFEARMRSA